MRLGNLRPSDILGLQMRNFSDVGAAKSLLGELLEYLTSLRADGGAVDDEIYVNSCMLDGAGIWERIQPNLVADALRSVDDEVRRLFLSGIEPARRVHITNALQKLMAETTEASTGSKEARSSKAEEGAVRNKRLRGLLFRKQPLTADEAEKFRQALQKEERRRKKQFRAIALGDGFFHLFDNRNRSRGIFAKAELASAVKNMGGRFVIVTDLPESRAEAKRHAGDLPTGR